MAQVFIGSLIACLIAPMIVITVGVCLWVWMEMEAILNKRTTK